MNREIKFRFGDGNRMLDMDYVDSCVAGLSIFKKDKIVPLQGTGLTDKNGVEIYEGDILLNTTIKPQKIKIVKKEVIGAFGEAFCIEKINDYDNMTGRYDMDKIEVIGNVFENPDLLNK